MFMREFIIMDLVLCRYLLETRNLAKIARPSGKEERVARESAILFIAPSIGAMLLS